MRKRLGLFIIGFVLALGAFFIYQFVTGASLLPQKPLKPDRDVVKTSADRSQTYEFRKKSTGELKYIITAKSADPVKDKDGNVIPGQYKITEPSATFYMKDGRTMSLRADLCNLVLDQLPKTAKTELTDTSEGQNMDLPPFQVRVGTLSGNVLLTISAKPYVVGDPKPMDGELTVAFDGDVQIFQNQNLITSAAPVHIRSDVLEYDGEALNLSFNRDAQRIEFLRIDKGDTVIVRNVGKQAFSMDSEEGDKRISKAPAKAVAPVVSPVAATLPAAGPIATVKPAAATMASAAAAGTQPKKKQPYELTSYKMSFGNDVEASVGGRSLSSAQLFVLFQPGSQDLEKASKAPAARDAGPAAHKAPGGAVPAATARAMARNTSQPAPLTAAERHARACAPYAPAGPEDLVIHWRGPMEMRPSGPDDLQLVGGNDRALEAVGTREHPVVLKDELRTVTAGRLWYHGAEDRIEIEPGDLPNVHMADTSQGTLACQGVSVLRGAGVTKADFGVVLKGPGTIEVPQSMMRSSAKASGRDPTFISWTDKADVEFAAVDDPKHAGKKTQIVKRAILRGDVAIKDSSYQMLADKLDVAVANVRVDNKTTPTLEHLLANGKVHVKFARGSGLGLDDASKPEGMNADNLEVFTEMRGGSKAPAPSRILATGNVVAWTFSREEREAAKSAGIASPPGTVAIAAVDKQPKKLLQETIFTPRLDIQLEAREKDKPSGIADSASPAGLLLGSGNALKSMNASEGVKVEIEGFENSGKFITATAQTLTADKTGRAILEGDAGINQPGGIAKKVQIMQGENQIAGDKVILDQKSHTMEIPGEGMFSFLQESKKGDAETTIQIAWTQKMTFDERSNTAVFLGHVETKQIGKPDQISEMTCKERLEVVLYPSRGGTGAKSGNDSAAGKLKSLLAVGDVQAKGATFEPATHATITSMELRTDKVQYSAESDVLNIPNGGSLLIEDYRAAKAVAARKRNDTPDGRGITAFAWKQNLSYVGQHGSGEPGTIRMNGDVRMRHVPTNGYEMVAASNKPTERKEVRLQGDSLVAHLAQSKEAGGSKSVSSPVGLGTGGDVKFADAKAIGQAMLTFGEDSISSDTLEFDSAHNIAVATGKPGAEAQVVRPGQGIMAARQILWDIAKNSFKITDSRGSFVR
jgi:lipopolysaccharide export system protein LptA